ELDGGLATRRSVARHPPQVEFLNTQPEVVGVEVTGSGDVSDRKVRIDAGYSHRSSSSRADAASLPVRPISDRNRRYVRAVLPLASGGCRHLADCPTHAPTPSFRDGRPVTRNVRRVGGWGARHALPVARNPQQRNGRDGAVARCLAVV